MRFSKKFLSSVMVATGAFTLSAAEPGLMEMVPTMGDIAPMPMPAVMPGKRPMLSFNESESEAKEMIKAGIAVFNDPTFKRPFKALHRYFNNRAITKYEPMRAKEGKAALHMIEQQVAVAMTYLGKRASLPKSWDIDKKMIDTLPKKLQATARLQGAQAALQATETSGPNWGKSIIAVNLEKLMHLADAETVDQLRENINELVRALGVERVLF